MRGIFLQIFGQVNDINSFKGTFLDANTATCLYGFNRQNVSTDEDDDDDETSTDGFVTLTNTERFRNKGKFTFRCHFNTKFAQFHHGTRLFTFLITLFGFALFRRDNRDTRQMFFIAILGFAGFFLGWHVGSVVGFCLLLLVVVVLLRFTCAFTILQTQYALQQQRLSRRGQTRESDKNKFREKVERGEKRCGVKTRGLSVTRSDTGYLD